MTARLLQQLLLNETRCLTSINTILNPSTSHYDVYSNAEQRQIKQKSRTSGLTSGV